MRMQFADFFAGIGLAATGLERRAVPVSPKKGLK